MFAKKFLQKKGFIPPHFYMQFFNISKLFSFNRNLRHTNQPYSKSGEGFTLIEMLIATTVFTMVVVGSIDILISAKIAQMKAAAIQNVLDNVRFSVETMTKDIRTGSSFSLVQCPPITGPVSQLNLTNQFGQPIAYAFYTPSVGTPGIYKIDRSINPDCTNTAASIPFTAPDVVAVLLSFRLTGQGANDGQPRVTVSLRARSNDKKTAAITTMNLETTVTQRSRDPNF
ncbi:MAG: prepilin-type N-terminal cleavage/methylation domain-containing protein [Candidatus Sungbacteria bacterium]|nr:prepilin-type N-terminal cleavage/methylation domain-containing protein [Candidatus Sungbacteria bacterium]